MGELKKIGVIGCGLMGSGIAETCARAGFEVVVREINESVLEAGLARIDRSVSKAVSRGKLAEDAASALKARLSGTVSLTDLADCDLIIEAIIENLDIKKSLFGELSDIVKPEAYFASNTSSLSITAMAAATNRPERFLGLHFFNPVPVMKLLEIVRGYQTSEETLAMAREFAAAVGKKTVLAKDTPGFIVNLLLVPYMLGAVRAYENGTATKEDIDTGITLGLNHPMGPFTLLDFVGLDTTLFIADAMYEEFKDPVYAAPPLLRQMVRAGHLGRKSGRGFYSYG